MIKIRFRCPICLQVVNGRNLRRHVRRLHDHEVSKEFTRHARKRLKTEGRIESPWDRWRVAGTAPYVGAMVWFQMSVPADKVGL